MASGRSKRSAFETVAAGLPLKGSFLAWLQTHSPGQKSPLATVCFPAVQIVNEGVVAGTFATCWDV